jgi:hypothetical protein
MRFSQLAEPLPGIASSGWNCLNGERVKSGDSGGLFVIPREC